MTDMGDVVLVYVEDAPAFFARIEEIVPDVKPQWYQVKLLVLQVPLLVITWILRRPYIDGDGFTMGGKPMRLEKVVAPREHDMSPGTEQEPVSRESGQEKDGKESGESPSAGEKSKVVSLLERRRKEPPHN